MHHWQNLGGDTKDDLLIKIMNYVNNHKRSLLTTSIPMYCKRKSTQFPWIWFLSNIWNVLTIIVTSNEPMTSLKRKISTLSSKTYCIKPCLDIWNLKKTAQPRLQSILWGVITWLIKLLISASPGTWHYQIMQPPSHIYAKRKPSRILQKFWGESFNMCP